MARNSRRDRKQTTPPAIARRPRPRPGTSATGSPAAGSVRAMAEAEDLGEAYAHVRRDMWRILIFGLLLFAAIYGSQFV